MNVCAKNLICVVGALQAFMNLLSWMSVSTFAQTNMMLTDVYAQQPCNESQAVWLLLKGLHCQT